MAPLTRLPPPTPLSLPLQLNYRIRKTLTNTDRLCRSVLMSLGDGDLAADHFLTGLNDRSSPSPLLPPFN